MKKFLITGSTSGLGLSVAHALADQDASLVLMGRDEEKMRTLENLSMHRLVEDFSKSTTSRITDLVAQMGKELGGFDGVFHAAGAEMIRPLRMTGDDHYREAMMCADSAFAILRACSMVGVMRDLGSIVLMSSVAAHRGTPGMVAYGAGKAAVEAMARSAASEFHLRHIRVNSIAAGAFYGPMHYRITKGMAQPAKDAYSRAHPLGIGEQHAVRDAALYLLSPASRWVTGTVHVVDGGYLAR